MVGRKGSEIDASAFEEAGILKNRDRFAEGFHLPFWIGEGGNNRGDGHPVRMAGREIVLRADPIAIQRGFDEDLLQASLKQALAAFFFRGGEDLRIQHPFEQRLEEAVHGDRRKSQAIAQEVPILIEQSIIWIEEGVKDVAEVVDLFQAGILLGVGGREEEGGIGQGEIDAATGEGRKPGLQSIRDHDLAQG